MRAIISAQSAEINNTGAANMQGFPFWQDWRFWEIVTTGVGALLGFLGATLIAHALERRRDRQRDRETAEVLAAALHAEICAMRSKAMQILGLLGRSSGVPDGGYDIGRAIGLPKAVVFERNVKRLGMLPADLARILVEFYGIRSAAEGMLDVADERHRPILLNWLLQVANTAPQSLMALDAFLRRPQQEYPAAAFEQAVDLPVKNIRPRRPADDVR
jgi:hypothetical protein